MREEQLQSEPPPLPLRQTQLGAPPQLPYQVKIMAPVDAHAKTRTSGTHRPQTSRKRSKVSKGSTSLARGQDRKNKPAQDAGRDTHGPATLDSQGAPIADRLASIRVQGRLQDMLRMEIANLGRAESILRSLWFAMESTDLTTKGVAYFPDAVEVAADLVERSKVDLEDLSDGRIPTPLTAALRVER